ncbi:hypothetical protein [Nocardia mangyaensis]|uniref:hypothetical protein n=1 Tax=Nocardia mangyaensis TaxID=2213200 RepID=UPI00267492A6|nr:hypothetical protein [Nocardia mangyaensis]MDO3650644.1 hypothetical protein [Nocardia mangyaensis]
MNDRQDLHDDRTPAAVSPTESPERRMPDEIRAHIMVDPDYVDCFRLATAEPTTWSPERWARTALDDIAGAKGQFIWRVVLGLRLAPGAPDHVAGWRIAERAPSWIRVEATGWLIAGEILVHLDDEYASMVTAVRYHRRPAARVWRALSGIHRKAVPELLDEVDALRRR